jgi:hypothetical protein
MIHSEVTVADPDMVIVPASACIAMPVSPAAEIVPLVTVNVPELLRIARAAPVAPVLLIYPVLIIEAPSYRWLRWLLLK